MELGSATDHELASALDRHREEIALAWAAQVRMMPRSRYGELSAEELRDAALRCLDAILDRLRTDSDSAFDGYLAGVSLSRLRQRFDIGEVIEGLLLWREISAPIVLRELTADWPRVAQTLSHLDLCVRRLVARFGQLYSEAVRRQLEEERQRTAVMEERQRLARELHDSVTQSLYSIGLMVEAAAERLAEGYPDRAAGYLRELGETAREALRDMRLLIFQLHPPILEKEGLTGAIQSRLEAVEARGGLETELRVDGDERLPLEIEEEIYRIAHEALNNVLKHAGARRVAVTLRLRPGDVALEVADDGVGFDPRLAWESGGLGLSGMRERALRLGGRLEVESAPGKGARVIFEMRGAPEEGRGREATS